MPSLNTLATQYQQNQVNNMNLGGMPQAPQAPRAGEGVSLGMSAQEVALAACRGYVAGYVMGNAPAITMSMPSHKSKDNVVSYDIIAKESKPSRMLAVLMALPACCCTRNGVLASPSDIKAGAIDSAIDPKEMIFQSFPQNAAISYISALGGKLPEYAPLVEEGAKKQWSYEDIIEDKQNVSFVYVRATANTSTKIPGEYRYSLKSSSSRRSLFTRTNVVCLRALQHVSTKCKNEKDAFDLNNSAFGAWQFTTRKADQKTKFQFAHEQCPTQIWTHKYEIDGQEQEGIGSIFFMAGDNVKCETGEMLTKKPLTYMPWWKTGELRKNAAPSTVEKIALRVHQESDGTHKENMVTKAVTFSDDPNNQLFRPYQDFVKFITETGFIKMDTLKELGSHKASSSRSKIPALSDDQMSALTSFYSDEKVEADIQAVIRSSAVRKAAADNKR